MANRMPRTRVLVPGSERVKQVRITGSDEGHIFGFNHVRTLGFNEGCTSAFKTLLISGPNERHNFDFK